MTENEIAANDANGIESRFFSEVASILEQAHNNWGLAELKRLMEES